MRVLILHRPCSRSHRARALSSRGPSLLCTRSRDHVTVFADLPVIALAHSPFSLASSRPALPFARAPCREHSPGSFSCVCVYVSVLCSDRVRASYRRLHIVSGFVLGAQYIARPSSAVCPPLPLLVPAGSTRPGDIHVRRYMSIVAAAVSGPRMPRWRPCPAPAKRIQMTLSQ